MGVAFRLSAFIVAAVYDRRARAKTLDAELAVIDRRYNLAFGRFAAPAMETSPAPN
jgi:hypothetical protein